MQTKIKISTQTLIIKVLSLAMSAVMTLSLIPITAFAENNSTEVTGKNMNSMISQANMFILKPILKCQHLKTIHMEHLK